MSKTRIQTVLEVAAKRDSRLKVPARPTLAEAIARVALNRKDPEKALRTAASQIGSKDPLRHAVASIAKQLLRGRD